MKTFFKWFGILVIFLLAMVLIIPLFIPVNPLENTVPVAQLADEDSQFIQVGHPAVSLHYKGDDAEAANELTFVLLHGSTLNVESWQPVMSYFSSRGRVIAYDQVPYGLSDKRIPAGVSAAEHYSLDASVERLIRLLDALEAERVILVGNSFGGVIATAALETAPERFEGVIFVDAAVYVNETMPGWLMSTPQMERLGPYLARGLGFNENFYQSMFADSANITDRIRAGAQLNVQADGWDMALWRYLQNWNYDTAALQRGLANISLPALVITGSEDAIVPVTDSLKLAETLPNASFQSLAQCGHLPQLECPVRFEEAVENWLAETF